MWAKKIRKDSLESVLNNLAGTAIYVIRQDNHKILYFNDRVREVTPEAAVNKVCHELWAGSCQNCPLPELENKDKCQMVNYNDPFGEVVDIAASRMLWEDKIPAFLISITPHKLTAIEQTDRQKEMEREWEAFNTGITKLFGECMLLNLDENTYTTAKSDNAIPDFPILGEFEVKSQEYCNRLIHPDDRKAFREAFSLENIRRSVDSGEDYIIREFRRLCTDGRYHYTEMLAVSAGGSREAGRRVILTFRDVDAVARKEEQKRKALKDALSLAEQASNAKTDFLSRMSHDIRTPMNAIIGMAAIAEANLNNPAKIADCLKKTKVAARYLLSLINDILEMSKIESGKMHMHREVFSLRKLVEELVDIVTPQIQEKHQQITLEISEQLKESYYGDRLRINQVLLNLLGNAIKYTPEGGAITLRVNQERESENKILLRLEVEDNGIGMSPEFMKRMYNPFEQERLRAKGPEGTGLGLAITRNLVRLMGGSIWAVSTPEKGSCFTVELPLIEEEKAGVESAEKSVLPQGSGNQAKAFGDMKMLVVEDNPLNQEIAETLFEMEGFSVTLAETGVEAVKAFSKSPEAYYQIILMDIQMPVMDGLEATRIIRGLERADAKTVPIIAMTAKAFAEDVTAAKEAGMNGHLAKPIDMSLAMEAIWEILS